MRQLLKTIQGSFLCQDRFLDPEALLLYYLTIDNVHDWIPKEDNVKTIGPAMGLLFTAMTMRAESKHRPDPKDYQVSKVTGRTDEITSIAVRKDLVSLIKELNSTKEFHAASCVNFIESILTLAPISPEVRGVCCALLAATTNGTSVARVGGSPGPNFGLFTVVEEPGKTPSGAQSEVISRSIQITSRTIKNVALICGARKSGRSVTALAAAGVLANKTKSKIYSLTPYLSNAGTISALAFSTDAEVAASLAKMIQDITNDNHGIRPIFLLDDIDVFLSSMMGHPLHLRQLTAVGAMFLGQNLITTLAEAGMVIGSTLKKDRYNAGQRTDMVKSLVPIASAVDTKTDDILEVLSAQISSEEASIKDLPMLIDGLVLDATKNNGTPTLDETIRTALLNLVCARRQEAPELAYLIIDQAQGIAKTAQKQAVDFLSLSQAARVFGLDCGGVSGLQSEVREKATGLKSRLLSRIFGQDQAIDIISAKVKIVLCGLNDPQKPLASLLFVGPTGVGKTEIVREIASHLSMNMIRIDMSEYSDPSSISKLIGTPPGYRDGERGGKLSNGLNLHPRSIVLLDEAEKAHPIIHNLFLQMMDNGEFSNGHGQIVSCRSAILIFTSNAGASSAASLSELSSVIGFQSKEGQVSEYTRGMEKALKTGVESQFAPEFRGRLDAMINFKSITLESALKVTDKLLGDLEANIWKRHGVKVSHSPRLTQSIISQGFSLELGARTLISQIDKIVKPAIADYFLRGLDHPGIVVDMANGVATCVDEKTWDRTQAEAAGVTTKEAEDELQDAG